MERMLRVQSDFLHKVDTKLSPSYRTAACWMYAFNRIRVLPEEQFLAKIWLWARSGHFRFRGMWANPTCRETLSSERL